MPMAKQPSLSAVSTISCGCEAPRRKEKLVVTASSAYALIRFLTRRHSGLLTSLGPGMTSRVLTQTTHHSRKQAMHEPARRCRLALVKSFTVEPETVAA